MNEHKKMIFFDIDGTLLDHDKNIPPSTKAAIKELKANGHEVAIATGRSPFLFKDLLEELEIDSYVSMNGQYVVYKGEVIYTHPIPSEVLQSLTAFAVRSDQPILYVSEEHMRMNVAKHIRVDSSYGPLKIEMPEYDPHYYMNREIYQAIVFCTEQEQVLYEQEYKDILRFVRWDEFATDVLPLGGSKAAGIERMINHLGINRKEVVAFGDHYNDLEMLQYVGHGVAMGNAQPEVKQVAKYITSDVDQDGIMKGLMQLNLISSAGMSAV